MSILHLDPKSQLALIFAASVTSLSGLGCGDRATVDPLPPPDDGGIRDGDAQADVLVADFLPPDAAADILVSDFLPPDAGADVPIADPLPIDAGDDVPIADPMPPDGSIFECMVSDMQSVDPPPPIRALPAESDLAAARARAARDDLPLARGLTVRIARATAPPEHEALRLRARPSYPSARLSYVWTASGGTLSSATAGEVTWTPPPGPGRYLIQVTVRDGERALAVDAITVVR